MARVESRYSLEAAPGSGDLGAPEVDSTNSSPHRPQTAAGPGLRTRGSKARGPFSARSKVDLCDKELLAFPPPREGVCGLVPPESSQRP